MNRSDSTDLVLEFDDLYPDIDPGWIDGGGGGDDADDGGPERGPREPVAHWQPEPELGHGFTVVLALTPIVFGTFTLLMFSAPASWGPWGAALLGAVFCVLYIGVFFGGSKWFEAARRN